MRKMKFVNKNTGHTGLFPLAVSKEFIFNTNYTKNSFIKFMARLEYIPCGIRQK